MAGDETAILIKGGRVYDHDGDTDRPPPADVLVRGDRIAAVGPEARVRLSEVVVEGAYLAPTETPRRLSIRPVLTPPKPGRLL